MGWLKSKQQQPSNWPCPMADELEVLHPGISKSLAAISHFYFSPFLGGQSLCFPWITAFPCSQPDKTDWLGTYPPPSLPCCLPLSPSLALPAWFDSHWPFVPAPVGITQAAEMSGCPSSSVCPTFDWPNYFCGSPKLGRKPLKQEEPWHMLCCAVQLLFPFTKDSGSGSQRGPCGGQVCSLPCCPFCSHLCSCLIQCFLASHAP